MPLLKTYTVPIKQFQLTLDGKTYNITRDEAEQLYSELGKELGKMDIEVKSRNCGNRMSHGPHADFKNNELIFCRGRRYDAT